MKMRCPECNGTGHKARGIGPYEDGEREVFTFDSCKTCNGKGKIDKPKDQPARSNALSRIM